MYLFGLDLLKINIPCHFFYNVISNTHLKFKVVKSAFMSRRRKLHEAQYEFQNHLGSKLLSEPLSIPIFQN